uniref:Uncharacterized protein n=1 Tax=Anguilla anguilla TaxID=7936 RepID=A0A0E9VBH0_ANGAN
MPKLGKLQFSKIWDLKRDF